MTASRLKVLHVVSTYAPAFRYGGTITSSLGLCQALAEDGNEVMVCTTNVNGRENMDFPIDQAVDREGVKVFYFPVAKRFDFLTRRLYYSPRMKRWLQANITNYDVVHLHTVFLWPTNIAGRLAKKAGVPYVLSPRGMLVKELLEKKNSFIKRCWIKFIESKTIKNASLLHFTSKRELSDAKKLGFSFPNSCVIPNGIELPSLLNKQENEQPYALYLGRINWKKGLDMLIEAISQCQSDNLKLILAGGDDNGCQTELTLLAQKLGIKDQIKFIGFVEGNEKQQLLSQAKCLLLCSDNENFGNVVLEALAQSTPVIVTKGVGAAEVVQKHDAGIVVEQQPAAIAGAIDTLWGIPEKANQLGQKGYEAVKKHYSWQSISKNIVKQYHELLSS